MVVSFLVFIALLSCIVCALSPEIASNIANSDACVALNNTFVNLKSEDIASMSGIMIPQLAALLAICITVFVFLFTELNTRAQDHPGERLICNDLQKDFALRVERLSVESILLVTLDYCSEHIYEFCIGDIHLGHFLYALLVLESFWASICMIWYCVDVAQYQRHLKWRAWVLTTRRFDTLWKNYGACFATVPPREDVSNFWSEYNMTSELVCTIAGEQDNRLDMNSKVIDRFKEIVFPDASTSDNALTQSLNNLYDYQLALSVYQGYVYSDDYANNDKEYTYSLKIVSLLLNLLNQVLDFWNRTFRKRPTVKDDKIPGMAAENGQPLAAQIAQGLWRQIVQGNGTSYPMQSQRLYNMAFQHLNFNNAQFTNVRIESCRIFGATFDHANIQEALFSDCDLRGTSFIDVDCTNLTLESSNLSNIVITNGALPRPEKNTILVPSNDDMLTSISFDRCTMERARIEPTAPKTSIALSDSDFSNVNLQNATIRDVGLDRCIFRSAWMSGAVLTGCKGESVDFTNALFIGSKQESCRLASCEFERSNISGCTFSNARIDGSKFPFINAANTVFDNVRIQHVSFENAAFTNASFLFASMEDISLKDTDLTRMHVVDPEITNCKFEGSAGDAFQIINGLVNDVTFLLSHLTSADFSRTKFYNCNFDKSSLSGALFHKTALSNTSFVETLLPNADFADSLFEDTGAIYAHFTGSLFDRSTLSGVTMEGSDLSNAMFRHASLTHCAFIGCEWEGTSFKNATLRNCSFSTSVGKAHKDLCHALAEASSLTSVTVNGEIIGQ